jgi:hypothetical protein
MINAEFVIENQKLSITSLQAALFSNTEYLHRHNLSAKIVHQFLAQRHKLITTDDPYYKYEPQPVLANKSTKVYWNRPVITDQTFLANRPDIIIIDKINKTAKLIDLAHPNDHNLNTSFSNKITKYKELADQIKAM